MQVTGGLMLAPCPARWCSASSPLEPATPWCSLTRLTNLAEVNTVTSRWSYLHVLELQMTGLLCCCCTVSKTLLSAFSWCSLVILTSLAEVHSLPSTGWVSLNVLVHWHFRWKFCVCWWCSASKPLPRLSTLSPRIITLLLAMALANDSEHRWTALCWLLVHCAALSVPRVPMVLIDRITNLGRGYHQPFGWSFHHVLLALGPYVNISVSAVGAGFLHCCH